MYLSGNQIEEVPTEIGNLVKLRWLNLQSNKIKNIPAEIGNLIKLKEFHLEHNPIAEIPADIWKNKKPPKIYLTYHPGLKMIPKKLAGYIYLNSTLIPEKYCDRPLQEWQSSWLLKEENESSKY